MNKNYVCNNRKCRYHDTTMIIHCARSISAEDDRPYALVCRSYMPPERGNEGCLQRLVGLLLCWIGVHCWRETGRPGLGTLTFYRCSRCGLGGNSHVIDDGEIWEDDPNN
jgi:hypothetical protein